MSVNSLYFSVLTLCVIFSTRLVISEEYVPVYFWESAKSYAPLPALARGNRQTFKEIVEDRLASDPVFVVFSEPSLSPEDFIEIDNSGQETFPFLSNIKSIAQVTYYPLVDGPISIIKHLPDVDVTQVNLKDFLKNPVLPQSRALLVDLNDASNEEDRIHMLRRHDSSIRQIYDSLVKENKNVLAIFTGHHSSWIIPEDVNKSRKTRSVSVPRAEGDDERVLYQTENFLLYVNSTAVVSNLGTKYNLSEHTASQSSIVNNSFTVDLSRASSATVRFSFLLTASNNWNLNDITVIDPVNTSNTFNLVPRSIGAPQRFSYQCTSQVFYERNNLLRNLSLPGMQIQPFVSFGNGSNATFGDPYFCVGFTTIPIWSGLFVTAILAIIMAIGLSMMMDIRTMDRFDDPKGKTISINVSE